MSPFKSPAYIKFSVALVGEDKVYKPNRVYRVYESRL